MKPDAQSPRERAAYNAEIFLMRIDIARNHLMKYQGLEEGVKLPNMAYLSFVKNHFFHEIKSCLSMLSFSSDMYEDVYYIVNSKRYKDIQIVTESDEKGHIWNLFSDFTVMGLQPKRDGTYFSFISSGRNCLPVHYINTDEPEDLILHCHDCDMQVVSFCGLKLTDYEKFNSDRHFTRMQVKYGEVWTCPKCGYRFVDLELPPKKLHDNYVKKMNVEV